MSEHYKFRAQVQRVMLSFLKGKTASGSRTLYHIGPNPATPRERSGKKFRPTGWNRDWLDETVYSGVFLSPDPERIHKNHGMEGNIYAYKVPEWVIKEAGGIHIYDTASEILISEELWYKALHHRDKNKRIQFLGKSGHTKQFKNNLGGFRNPKEPQPAIKVVFRIDALSGQELTSEKFKEIVEGFTKELKSNGIDVLPGNYFNRVYELSKKNPGKKVYEIEVHIFYKDISNSTNLVTLSLPHKVAKVLDKLKFKNLSSHPEINLPDKYYTLRK